MLSLESGKELFLLSFGCSFVVMAVGWLAFARLSMARIEREIKRDGLERPCPWDGVGGRALWYAFAIGLPIGLFNPRNDPLIDVPLVRKYARPLDRKLGLVFIVASILNVTLIFLGVFVFDYY